MLLKNNIRNLIPKESGILLRTTTQKEDSWFKRTDKKMFGTLPFKKKKTNSLAKRVGIKKETLVRASNINITAKDSKDVKKITEEIVFDDLIVDECRSVKEIYANDFPNVHITQSELKSLSDNEMVSDVVIDVAQKMMAKRHPWLKGLQDPILDQTMSFRHFQSQPFVQILHNGVAHWVAISTFNCKPGEIMLMYSLFKGRVSVHIKKQICFIMNSKEREIKIKVAGVQLQTNGIDFGLYAIA